jgi:hypothetical protein
MTQEDRAMDGLERCPFCQWPTNAVSDNGRGLVFNVRCGNGNCLATGPLERCAADAVSAWNTRALPAQPGEKQ